MDVVTERLVLHRIGPDEAARIVAGSPASEDRWHPEYPFADEVLPLRMLARAPDPHPVFTLYQVRTRSDGTAVGGIGFKGAPDAEGAVEVGYGLVAAVRGRGLATEAVIALTTVAFRHGASMVRADARPANAASQRVLEHAGFRRIEERNGLVFFELLPDRR